MNTETLRPFLPACALAVLTMLSSTGFGVAFGAAEDSLKSGLRADADAVVATVYGGDQGKADAVVNKSWSYFKRAHLHTGALGTEALALTLLMVLLVNAPRRGRVFAATTAALGGLGYGWFWFFAGMAAPGLGSTDAAKESMAFLALPAAAAVVVGTVTALMMIVIAWRRSSDDGGGTSPGA